MPRNRDKQAFPSGPHDNSGMDLRDWFAYGAMQSYMDKFVLRLPTDKIATRAYEIADAMMERRRDSKYE